MRKAKTNKLIIILSALLGVVFAFSVGYTFAAALMKFEYTSNPKSTQAYLGNNQMVLINSTKTNPIPFGANANNVEIAIEYSLSTLEDFDFRIEYSLSWSGGASKNNVILNFANRDNLIVDESYIFGNSGELTNRNGRIAIISTIDFVDLNDKTYIGKYLTIEASLFTEKGGDTVSCDGKTHQKISCTH